MASILRGTESLAGGSHDRSAGAILPLGDRSSQIFQGQETGPVCRRKLEIVTALGLQRPGWRSEHALTLSGGFIPGPDTENSLLQPEDATRQDNCNVAKCGFQGMSECFSAFFGGPLAHCAEQRRTAKAATPTASKTYCPASPRLLRDYLDDLDIT